MELTEENVLKGLAELGSTPEEIAKNLKAQGIKGYRFICHICPIAKYLAKKLSWDPDTLDVGPDTINFHKVGEGTVLRIHTPAAIRDFIRKFDAGGFQFLVA